MSKPTPCAGCSPECDAQRAADSDWDCPCNSVCGEEYCERHGREEEARWFAYFKAHPATGSPQMSDAEWRDFSAECARLKS